MRLPPGYCDLVARHEQLDVPGRGSAKVRDPQPGCRRRTAAPAAAMPCSSGDAGVLDSAAVAAAHPSGRLTAADNWPVQRAAERRGPGRCRGRGYRSTDRGGAAASRVLCRSHQGTPVLDIPQYRHPQIADEQAVGDGLARRFLELRGVEVDEQAASADRAFTDTRWSAFTRAAQSTTHGYRHIYFGSGDRVSSRGGDRACRQSRPWRRRLAEDARGQESASTTSLTRCRSLSRIA